MVKANTLISSRVLRFHRGKPNEQNIKKLLKECKEESLIGIFDEKSGGIIGYLIDEGVERTAEIFHFLNRGHWNKEDMERAFKKR